jgi:hypothetical protein
LNGQKVSEHSRDVKSTPILSPSKTPSFHGGEDAVGFSVANHIPEQLLQPQTRGMLTIERHCAITRRDLICLTSQPQLNQWKYTSYHLVNKGGSDSPGVLDFDQGSDTTRGAAKVADHNAIRYANEPGCFDNGNYYYICRPRKLCVDRTLRDICQGPGPFAVMFFWFCSDFRQIRYGARITPRLTSSWARSPGVAASFVSNSFQGRTEPDVNVKIK